MDVHPNSDVQAAERIFRKIVHPGLDSLRLVDRNGIPLQNHAPGALRQRSFVLSPRGVPTKVTNHMYSGRHSHMARYSDGFSRTETPEFYTEDSLVMPSNFATTKSAPQSGLPKRRALPRKSTRNGLAAKSATIERHLGGTFEDKRHLQSASSGSSRWNMSSQKLRLEKEWSEVANSRTLKRNAEILPHRVDRMYFMSGSSVNLKPRYQVDDDELQQLRDLSKSRQSSRKQHRGSRYSAKTNHHKNTPAETTKNVTDDADVMNGENAEVTDNQQPDQSLPSKPHPSKDMKVTGRESPLEGWESPTKELGQGEVIRKMSLHDNAGVDNDIDGIDFDDVGNNNVENQGWGDSKREETSSNISENKDVEEVDNDPIEQSNGNDLKEEDQGVAPDDEETNTIGDYNTNKDENTAKPDNQRLKDDDGDTNELFVDSKNNETVNSVNGLTDGRPDGRKSADNEVEQGEETEAAS